MDSNIKTRIWQILGVILNQKPAILTTSQYFSAIVYMWSRELNDISDSRKLVILNYKPTILSTSQYFSAMVYRCNREPNDVRDRRILVKKPTVFLISIYCRNKSMRIILKYHNKLPFFARNEIQKKITYLANMIRVS